jgi:hypothetical protein
VLEAAGMAGRCETGTSIADTCSGYLFAEFTLA